MRQINTLQDGCGSDVEELENGLIHEEEATKCSVPLFLFTYIKSTRNTRPPNHAAIYLLLTITHMHTHIHTRTHSHTHTRRLTGVHGMLLSHPATLVVNMQSWADVVDVVAGRLFPCCKLLLVRLVWTWAFHWDWCYTGHWDWWC